MISYAPAESDYLFNNFIKGACIVSVKHVMSYTEIQIRFKDVHPTFWTVALDSNPGIQLFPPIMPFHNHVEVSRHTHLLFNSSNFWWSVFDKWKVCLDSDACVKQWIFPKMELLRSKLDKMYPHSCVLVILSSFISFRCILPTSFWHPLPDTICPWFSLRCQWPSIIYTKIPFCFCRLGSFHHTECLKFATCETMMHHWLVSVLRCTYTKAYW